MTSKPKDKFLIVGAGSHAHRVAEAIRANGDTVLGFATTVGQATRNHSESKPEPTLRLEQALERFPDAAIVVAIGDTEARRTIVDSIRQRGRRLPPIVHPLAIISPSADVSDATVVLAGAVVEYQASVELGAIVDVHAVICHEARIGPMSHVQPGTIVGPRAQVPAGTKTGVGERILEAQASSPF
jgi:tetrahydrodipicolinate N-succinyltransferase